MVIHPHPTVSSMFTRHMNILYSKSWGWAEGWCGKKLWIAWVTWWFFLKVLEKVIHGWHLSTNYIPFKYSNHLWISMPPRQNRLLPGEILGIREFYTTIPGGFRSSHDPPRINHQWQPLGFPDSWNFCITWFPNWSIATLGVRIFKKASLRFS